jgi:4-aminobutyrate aminotransferase
MKPRLLHATQEWAGRESRVISDVLKIRFYPFVAAQAEGVRQLDPDGNVYLDFLSSGGVMQTGYRHPKVRARIIDELDRSWSNMLCCYPNMPAVELAERLSDLLPGTFPKKVWFGTTGSDANDCLSRLAPLASGKRRLISYIGAYHGQTTGSAQLSGHSTQAKVLGGGHITKVPYPYCYRCLWGFADPDTCSLACLDYLKETVLTAVSPADDTAAIVLEAMQSDGGDIPAPTRYLRQLRELCDELGIWLCFDEVKSGLGRTGKMFAFEHSGVEADAVSLGKPLGGGLPLSAVVGRAELLDVGTYDLHTLGGSPVPCAGGLATLDVLQEEALAENAARMGARLVEGLLELAVSHPLIGDVRAMGLMVGVELVSDRETKVPAAQAAAQLVYRCFELGFLVFYCGMHANVIEMTPSLTVSEADVDEALSILDEALSDVEAGRVDDAKISAYRGW